VSKTQDKHAKKLSSSIYVDNNPSTNC